MRSFRSFAAILAAAVATVLAAAALADEGMWTFDNPPVATLESRYGFAPSQAWLDRVRLASVRLNDGGSGSFVSPSGLVMTNHHVALQQLQKLSTESADYVANGFYAPTAADELRAPDLEIDVLVEMEDVTERVRSAVAPTMSDAEALKARQAAIAAIEKESQEATGLRSTVVSLYHGGEYWLYRYKRYTDVRLVFAPEKQAAFFGGDWDNFTYPRYCLDVAFLRVYEDGRPASTPDFLPLHRPGPSEGDLVFVSGNPGSTDRLFTTAQLEYQRDVRYPVVLGFIDGYLALLRDYASRGEEEARRVQFQLMGFANAKKALEGEYRGLRDDALMARLREREAAFRSRVAADPDLEARYGDAWERIAGAVAEAARTYRQRLYRTLRGSTLAGHALALVRHAAEIEKPDGERLPGYHDAELEQLEFRVLSPAPVYLDQEQALFAAYMELVRRELGEDDAFVKAVLEGREPAAVAAELFGGTRLADVAERKRLWDGGREAVAASTDPLVALARRVDPILREDEAAYRDRIESVLTEAGEKIAAARFAVYGKSVYPDATFTLRLAYGTVRGYPMNGTRAPYRTTLYGLFDRSLSFDRREPFSLPERFWARKASLDLATPVNFVSTVDIIGGNSGSPVIDRQGRAVGLIFDGNIESLVSRFVYDDERARAVAVHPAYILEALAKLYDATRLVDELEKAAAGSASR